VFHGNFLCTDAAHLAFHTIDSPPVTAKAYPFGFAHADAIDRLSLHASPGFAPSYSRYGQQSTRYGRLSRTHAGHLLRSDASCARQRMPGCVPVCVCEGWSELTARRDRCASDAGACWLLQAERYRDTEPPPGARGAGAPRAPVNLEREFDEKTRRLCSLHALLCLSIDF
jgi:hypothetical protein